MHIRCLRALLCWPWLLLVACPVTTVDPWQIQFECRTNLDCDPAHVCVAERCVARGQVPSVDSGVVELDAARDGAAASDAAARPDAMSRDRSAQDLSVAQDAAGGLDLTALVDGHGLDVSAVDAVAPDTLAPDIAAPDIAALDTVAPDTATPDTAAPDAAAPDTATPDTATPDTAAVDSGPACVDEDGDQRGENCAAGPDCNDNDRDNWLELAGWVDADGDGFTVGGSVTLCTAGSLPAGYAAAASAEEDCDDDGVSGCGDGCFPGNSAADVCDDHDQDCDTQIDEDPEIAWYHDADGDGFLSSSDTQHACEDPDGAGTEWMAASLGSPDCDDDPLACGVNCAPGLDESWLGGTCSDTWDNDCAQGADAVDPGCERVVPSNIPVDKVCANATDLELPAARTLNTDSGTIGGSSVGDSVYSRVAQGGGAPDIAVFAYRRISIPYKLTVTGTLPLALVACGEVQVGAQIDLCADNTAGGPGGYNGGGRQADGAGYASSAGGRGASRSSSPWERSGGGGAANGAPGARGGFTNSSYPAGAPGQSIAEAGIVPLVGGGGGGGGGQASYGGAGGGGGGALQIVSNGAVTITSAGGVHACGAGGRGGLNASAGGGGGGGAGGSVLIEGVSVDVQGTLAANGGGGGGGAQYSTANGVAGDPGPYGSGQASGGGGGGNAGDGGRGGSSSPGSAGEQGQDVNPCGGGGGGAGRIRINTLGGQATVSGTVSPDSTSGLFTQGQVTTQ